MTHEFSLQLFILISQLYISEKRLQISCVGKLRAKAKKRAWMHTLLLDLYLLISMVVISFEGAQSSLSHSGSFVVWSLTLKGSSPAFNIGFSIILENRLYRTHISPQLHLLMCFPLPLAPRNKYCRYNNSLTHMLEVVSNAASPRPVSNLIIQPPFMSLPINGYLLVQPLVPCH